MKKTLLADAINYHDRLSKHDSQIDQLLDRMETLEFSYRDTDLTVKKETITYKMMKIAIEAATQEYDKRMAKHLKDIKDYVQNEIADFITREVSFPLDLDLSSKK